MNYTKILKEIQDIQKLIEKWEQQRITPQIEKDIVMTKLGELYSSLLDVETVKAQEGEQDNQKDENIVEDENQNCVEEQTSKEQNDAHQPEPQHETQSEHESQLETEPQSEPQPESQHEHEPQSKSEPQLEQQPQPQLETEKNIELGQTDAKFADGLFNGNKELYILEVKKMLAMANLNAILIYISENFNWDAQNKLAQEFVNKFIERFS